MKVISFNIKVGVDSHISSIATDLYRMMPDIAVFQEIGKHWNMGVSVHQTAYLCSALGFQYQYFVPALQDRHGGQFGISLISRYPIENAHYELLPQIKDEQRVLLKAKIHSDIGSFWLFNSHFSIEALERELQFQKLAQEIKKIIDQEPQTPLLIMGDFNEPCHNTLIKDLCKNLDLIDSWEYTHLDQPKEEGFSFSVKNPNRRIDYILVKGFEVLAADVLKNFKSSDHFPISAILREIK